MVRRSGVVGKKKPAGYIIIILAALNVLGCEADDDADQKYCYNCNINNPSPCRNFVNISYPFRLKDDPADCGGDPRYNLSCENNRTVLHWRSGKYYVESISYETQTMRAVDSGLQIDNCSSLPLQSFTFLDTFSYPQLSEDNQLNDPFYYPLPDDQDPLFFPRWHSRFRNNNYIVFMTCESPITSTAKYSHLVNTSPCINASSSSSGSHSYAIVGDQIRCSDVPDSCTIGDTFPILYWDDHDSGRYNRPFSQIHHQLAMGFQLSWIRDEFGSCNKTQLCSLTIDRFDKYYCECIDTCVPGKLISGCLYQPKKDIAYRVNFYWHIIVYHVKASGLHVVVGISGLRILLGILCLSILVIYKLRRRHFSMDANIEEFLQEHNNLMLLQYSYSDIKKMTKHFRNKLGRGGFGSVYEGKLRSGNLVAVKMLENSKGNGQDFINEVATIGRIHHVNVVQLIGFCFEGSKRALLYDFMPNGSLDKYIFSSTQEQTGTSLSWENTYKIALGVAHGIEYLHRGCDMQILHFDIKPHNILLDEDFTAKISDFGLAKLYPTNYNTVPLTMARGTIGYIAPELVYKSMGGVSYKADVYSFGMLLMEMAGRRKNVNPFANTSSQTYFPSWIYEKLNQGEDIEMEDANEEDKQMVRKVIIVALFCIQWKPGDRPSMSRVIEMLESPTELLQMPPKPFLGSSFEGVEEDHTIIEPSTTSLHSSSFSNYSLEIESN